MPTTRKPDFFNWGGRRVLAVYDGMSDRNKQAIAEESYDSLCLFYGDWTDLSYLAEVADKVVSLEVACAGLCDLEGLYALKNLRYLRLAHVEPTAPKQGFDFSRFAQLATCYVDWRPRYANLFSHPALTHLTIWRYPFADLAPFAGAVALHSLAMQGGSLASLAGIEGLPMLRELDLGGLRKLCDIGGLADTPAITSMHISKCPALLDVLPAFSLEKLEMLAYSGKVALPGLHLLAKMAQLRECVFDCPIVEQDFAVLFNLMQLESARFIQLADCRVTQGDLEQLAAAAQREVRIELMGKQNPTIIFDFGASALRVPASIGGPKKNALELLRAREQG